MAIALLQGYVKEFQDRRKEVSDETLKAFMTPRKLIWNGNPNPKPKEVKPKEAKGKENKENKAKK